MSDLSGLNLEPRLNHPLSLWNPLDYLRLLGWVFFFPQAIDWYVERFAGGNTPPGETSWRREWTFLRVNTVRRTLVVQTWLLIMSIPLLLSSLLTAVGIGSSLANGAVSMIVVLVLMVGPIMTESMADRVRTIVVAGVLGGVAGIVPPDLTEAMAAVTFGMILSLSFGGVRGVRINAVSDVLVRLWGGVSIMVTVSILGIVTGRLQGSVTGVLMAAVVAGIVVGSALGAMSLRPGHWLAGSLLALIGHAGSALAIAHPTALPLWGLRHRLAITLRADWLAGIGYVNQILAYTLQFIPAAAAVEQVLAETQPAQLLPRIAVLTCAPFDWGLVRYATTSLRNALSRELVRRLVLVPLWGRRLAERYDIEPRIDTPARAACAGFWYLHEKKADLAADAFARLHRLPYGMEMFALTVTLKLLNKATALPLIASVNLPAMDNLPTPQLRPESWQAIGHFRRATQEARAVQNSYSRSARSLALNRALGELTAVLEDKSLPEPEKDLILDAAEKWREALLAVAGEVGEVNITEAVANPYVIGDPVRGRLFVGREDILGKLEEWWQPRAPLQSVVLFGHRRMGKTSILLNLPDHLGAGIALAYVNLQLVGKAENAGQVLMTIADRVGRATGVQPPGDADLLALPYQSFERYLTAVVAALDERGLIIALDEFESLDEWSKTGAIPPDFVRYLRGLVQMHPRLGFVFAGLHTLEEMTADYFQPFFASVIPLHVSFMREADAKYLLANPADDFLLDYDAEALEQAWRLSGGQPFLVQLLGFSLVNRYNDQRFERHQMREPRFSAGDVAAAVADPEFYQLGRYYFAGVWGQAGQGIPGQQTVLRALAPRVEGLPVADLQAVTGLDDEALRGALQALARHDVLKEQDGRWGVHGGIVPALG